MFFLDQDNRGTMCVDYRQLNNKSRKDAFFLPRIEESLDALTGACLRAQNERWLEECHQAQKTKLTTTPVLAYADLSLPFIL